MAEYQREFLVQYLKDISALHLARHKLQERLSTLESRKRTLEKGVHHGEMPMKPHYEAANGVFFLGLGAFTVLSSLKLFLAALPFLGWACVFFGILIIAIGGIRYLQVLQDDAQKKERYNRKLSIYRQIQKKNDRERKNIPQIEQEILECEAEIERVRQTLHKVYRANVVPPSDRNLYAAVFLYVWVCTGRCNNIELALTQFVFQETKEKLDQIIVSETEVFLKQYFGIAEQRPTPKLQREYAATLVQKLKQLNIPKEDMDPHLAMIASHTATTSFFATATYLSKI